MMGKLELFEMLCEVYEEDVVFDILDDGNYMVFEDCYDIEGTLMEIFEEEETVQAMMINATILESEDVTILVFE